MDHIYPYRSVCMGYYRIGVISVVDSLHLAKIPLQFNIPIQYRGYTAAVNTTE